MSSKKSGSTQPNPRPTRVTRQQERKSYADVSKRGKNAPPLYDNKGIHIASGKDFCDCLEDNCVGCHMPCPKCQSRKCGHECRVNRKWGYDSVAVQGTDNVRKNKNT